MCTHNLPISRAKELDQTHRITTHHSVNPFPLSYQPPLINNNNIVIMIIISIPVLSLFSLSFLSPFQENVSNRTTLPCRHDCPFFCPFLAFFSSGVLGMKWRCFQTTALEVKFDRLKTRKGVCWGKGLHMINASSWGLGAGGVFFLLYRLLYRAQIVFLFPT